MQPTVVIDTRGCTSFLNQLARELHIAPREAIRFEAGRILQTCVRNTPSNTAAQMKRTIEKYQAKYNNYAGGIVGSKAVQNEYPRISIAPRKGHHWWVDRNLAGKRTFYIMKGGNPNLRWSDERWAAYQREEADRLADLSVAQQRIPAIKRARGVAKASWLRIAQSAGIDIDVPAYVKTAVPSSGDQNIGEAHEQNEPGGYYIDLINHYGLLIRKLGGERILQSAVAGRINKFEHGVARGVFNDIARAAKAYPGIEVYRMAA